MPTARMWVKLKKEEAVLLIDTRSARNTLAGDERYSVVSTELGTFDLGQ